MIGEVSLGFRITEASELEDFSGKRMNNSALKNICKPSVLFVLLISTLACNILPGEDHDVVKGEPIPLNETTDDVTIWFNGERIGGLEKVDALTEKVQSVVKDRSNRGVFVEGTNEINKSVYIVIDANLPLRSVYLIQNTADTTRYWPTKFTKTTEGQRDPLLLAVVVQNASSPKPSIPFYPSHLKGNEEKESSMRLSLTKDSAEYTESERRDLLKYTLVRYGGLEIDHAGRLSLIVPFSQEEVLGSKDLDSFEVQRRPVKLESLEKEVDTLFPGFNEFHIYADENLGFQDLRRILETIGETKGSFIVILTRNGKVLLKND
ncbi:MAG TPA: hypothetical protein VMM38_05855 [Aridibacter sp.]|nr:hypothetical protein [Aridibacter sp.]